MNYDDNICSWQSAKIMLPIETKVILSDWRIGKLTSCLSSVSKVLRTDFVSLLFTRQNTLQSGHKLSSFQVPTSMSLLSAAAG